MRRSQIRGSIKYESVMNARKNRYRAVNKDGEYLHMNGVDTTKSETFAWRGNETMLRNLGKDTEFTLVPIRSYDRLKELSL